MRKLRRWLKKEPFGLDLFDCILLFLLFDVLCSIVTVTLLFHFGVLPKTTRLQIEIMTVQFPVLLFLGALIEEILFRAPLTLFARRRYGVLGLLICSSLLSACFGWLHGGFTNIFLQGAGGMFFSILYLKCGGIRGKLLKPLAATVACHFAFNGFLALSLLTSGHRFF